MNTVHQPASAPPGKPALPTRLANIQALRALAVFLVVLVHLQVNETRITQDPVLSPWLYHGVSGVDLFFVISGFIMVYISHHKFGSFRHSVVFILDRVARIYPPAILFTALALVGMVLAGTADKWFPENNLVFSFLLLPQPRPPLLGVSWTLIHELYFYLVFAIFLLGRFRFLPVLLLLWAGMVWWAQPAGLWTQNPWTMIVFHPLTIEFILGAAIGLCAVYFRPKWGLAFLLAGAVLFVAGALWIGFPSAATYPQGWGRVIAFSPGAALMVYGAFALEATGRWRAPKILIMAGNWSYSLYLSHLLVIASLAHVWTKFALAGKITNLLFLPVSLASVIIVAIIAYYGFERPVLRRSKSIIRRFIKDDKGSLRPGLAENE